MSEISVLSREGLEQRLASNPAALAAYLEAMGKFVNNSAEQNLFHLSAVAKYLNIPWTDEERKQAEPFLKDYQAAGRWSGIDWKK